MINFKKYYKSIIWASVILFLSLARIKTSENINPLDLPLDKIAHFGMYFILTILILLETRTPIKLYKKSKLVKSLLFINLYGLLIEFLQFQITSYRSGDILDFISNLSGSITGLMIYFYSPFNKILTKILK